MKQIKKKIIIKNPNQPCEYNNKNICIHCGKSLRETLQSLQDMLVERGSQIKDNRLFIRICTTCNKEYPATTEYFYKDKSGLRTSCKECFKDYQRLKA